MFPGFPVSGLASGRQLIRIVVLAILLGGVPLSASRADEPDRNSAGAPPATAADERQSVLALFSRDGMRDGIQQAASQTGDLVMRALSLIGVRYKRGGNSEDSGLDCSGLVNLVFRDTLSLQLPRRAEEISRVGDKVDKDQLKPGDLVFYNTLRRAFSHVGIYLGDGRFIHAPARGGAVRVENMDQPYWSKRFNGARRVSKDD